MNRHFMIRPVPLILIVLTMAVRAGAGAQTREPAAVRPGRTLVIDTVRDTTHRVPQQGRARVRQAPNCMRVQPAPLCTIYMLNELALEYSVVSTRRMDSFFGSQRDFGARMSLQTGVMRNVGRHSFGGAVGMGFEIGTSDFALWTLEGRYKRWLTRTRTIDAGVGYKRMSMCCDDKYMLLPAHGVTAFVGVMPGRVGGFTLRADFARDGKRTASSISTGIVSNWVAEKLVRYTIAGLTRGAFDQDDIEIPQDP